MPAEGDLAAALAGLEAVAPAPEEVPEAPRASAAPRPPAPRASEPKGTSTPRPVVAAPAPALAAPSGAPPPTLDLSALQAAAAQGLLSAEDTRQLEAIARSNPAYSAARSALLANAERKGDPRAARRYLEELLAVPENRYNAVFLTKDATWLIQQKRYAEALARAQDAERHWARIPPDLVFATKADLYEAQAAAWLGLFYQNPSDPTQLDQAIRAWERYRQHVSSRGDATLTRKADTQLARLRDMRARLP